MDVVSGKNRVPSKWNNPKIRLEIKKEFIEFKYLLRIKNDQTKISDSRIGAKIITKKNNNSGGTSLA